MPARHPFHKLARSTGHKESDDAFSHIMHWTEEGDKKKDKKAEKAKRPERTQSGWTPRRPSRRTRNRPMRDPTRHCASEGWTRHGGSCTNSTHDGGLVFQGRRGPGTRAVSHTAADDKNGEEASFYRCLVPSFNL